MKINCSKAAVKLTDRFSWSTSWLISQLHSVQVQYALARKCLCQNKMVKAIFTTISITINLECALLDSYSAIKFDYLTSYMKVQNDYWILLVAFELFVKCSVFSSDCMPSFWDKMHEPFFYYVFVPQKTNIFLLMNNGL